MPFYKIDLHIHTPASTCFFDKGYSHENFAWAVKAKVLDMIAVSDHHSVDSIEPVRVALKGEIEVLSGIEFSCRIDDIDEVFILGIFSPQVSISDLRDLLRQSGIGSRAQGRGDTSVEDVGKLVTGIRKLKGIVFACRMDKTAYREKAIPALIKKYKIRNFDLVSIDYQEKLKNFEKEFGRFNYFTFSDAHSLNKIGTRFSTVEMKMANFPALKKLLGD